jgi:hypothetical protein
MSVQRLITRSGASESDYYCMTGAMGWGTVWLPAAVELGLDLIPLLGDGTFATVPPESLAQVVAQLATLRGWMAERRNMALNSLIAELIEQAVCEDDSSPTKPEPGRRTVVKKRLNKASRAGGNRKN